MDLNQVREVLRKTLEDRQLTRAEKRAMSSLVEVTDPTPQVLANYRHEAFELARTQLADPKSKEVLDWLEEVVKVMLPSNDPAQTLLAEAYFSPGDACVNKVMALIRKVQKTADICVFTITDDRVSDALIDAHRRGIKVRIITDNDKAIDLGSDIERLGSAGIPVRMDMTEFHMHHKFALFDGHILLTGSYNWTRSAAMNNQENIVLSGEHRLISTFSELFEKLWKEFA